MLWGFFGTLIVKVINPLLFGLFNSFNIYIAGIVELTLFGLLLVDLFTSFVTLEKIKSHRIKEHDDTFW